MAIEKISSLSALNVESDNKKKKNAKSGTDFKALLADTIGRNIKSFEETGLTPSDQLVKSYGGDNALEAKHELQREHDDDEEKSEDAKGSASCTASKSAGIETIKKYMPDGSILVVTTENGRTIDQYRKKPHMVERPDYSRPMKVENGTLKPQTKLVPKQNLSELFEM